MARAAKPGPPPDPAPKPEPPRPRAWRCWVAPLVRLVVLGVTKVDANQVEKVTVDDVGTVTGTLRDGTSFTSRVPAAVVVDIAH